jgi:catechol 2,3-dioxygenase-like lactoylglutathione lyase family enzyme
MSWAWSTGGNGTEMSYHHLAMAARDMAAIHDFYERITGFELVKVEIAPMMGGGWGKHFFYRMDGDDSSFIAFWELNEVPNADAHEFNLNKAAHMPTISPLPCTAPRRSTPGATSGMRPGSTC